MRYLSERGGRGGEKGEGGGCEGRWSGLSGSR